MKVTDPNLIKLLKDIKGRLEQTKTYMKIGSLGEYKNQSLIDRIDAVLPEDGPNSGPKNFDPALVYPS